MRVKIEDFRAKYVTPLKDALRSDECERADAASRFGQAIQAFPYDDEAARLAQGDLAEVSARIARTESRLAFIAGIENAQLNGTVAIDESGGM